MADVTKKLTAAALLCCVGTASTVRATPGFQAHALLPQGYLTWSFDVNGGIASRTIGWPDASSRGELYGTSGRYEGMTVTRSTGTGSLITRRYDTAGAETGYSIVTSASAMGGVSSHPVVSTQYGAPGGRDGAAVLGRSVKTTSVNPHGGFQTITRTYATIHGASTEALVRTTVTETRESRAVSTDYTPSGQALARRILVVNPDKSSTLTNFDGRGTVLGSGNLSMKVDGTVLLKTYDAVGQIISIKTLTQGGTMTDTSYRAGRVVGRSVWTPTAVGGDVTTYFSASGTKIGDWWVAPDGTYGSDTPSPNGVSTGIEHYRNSSWSRTENNGRGRMTVTYYSSKGVQIGRANVDLQASGVTSRYLSTDGVVRAQAVIGADGSLRATAYRPGGRSIGFSLTGDGDFSRLVAGSGTTRAYSFDRSGFFAGNTVTSETAFSGEQKGNAPAAKMGKSVIQPGPGGQVTIENFYSNGNMSGYELERQDASGGIEITAYDLEGYVQESIKLDPSGVIRQMLGVTSSGMVTTTWQTDGSYRQVIDDGEGHVTIANYSVDGKELASKRSDGDRTSQWRLPCGGRGCYGGCRAAAAARTTLRVRRSRTGTLRRVACQ